MRLVFLIFSIFIFIHSGLSQSTMYFKTYDFGTGSNPIFTYPLETENGLIIQGQIKSPNTKIFFSKLSSQGFFLDSLIYGDSASGHYIIFPMIRFDSKKMFSIIGWENTSPYLYSNSLIYLDTSLQITNDSTYFIGNNYINNTFLQRVVLFNSKLYFGGFTYLNNNSDSVTFNILFWKSDTIFNYITHNSIGNDAVLEDLVSIHIGFDNNLLLGGLILTNGSQQDWYLINVDTNGTVLGEFFYGHPLKSDYDGIKSISLGADSSYYLSGVFYMYDFGAGNFYYAAKVVKLDRFFNTLWTKQIGSTVKGISVQKLIPTSDKNNAILTQRMPEGLNSRYYSQISKFNNNCNILWSRNYYQGDTTQYIRYRAWDMIETSDSGFALCGSAFDTTNVGPNQQAWLVKTDSLGCDGLRSCNDTALVVEILNYPDTLCQNDTNFVDVSLKGRSAPYSLYANGTLALDSIYYPYTLPLWIDTTIMVFPTDTGWQSLIVNLHEPWERIAGDTVQVYVKNCISTYASQDFYNRKVEIYPNPATSEIHIKVRGIVSGTYIITIYDIQGKPIRSITTNEPETVLDISQLPKGIYGVKVIGSNVMKYEKVVKI